MENNTNIWEEKSYIEPKKNCLQCSEPDQNDSTTIIEKKLKKEISKDTLKISQWKRNCPKCNKILFYNLRGGYTRATKKNTLCKICSITKIDKNQKYTRNCPNCNRVLTYSLKGNWKFANKYNRICKSCSGGGRIRKKWKVYTDEDFQRNCPKCNKILIHINKAHRNHARKINKLCRKCSSNSEECKKKHRINYLKRLEENGGVQPFYNINACEVIDEYGKQNGYNFQHGLNGGEVSFIGYFVDGYDKEKNVVFEYDESHHYSMGNLKDDDIHRMDDIKKHLNCRFIRYNEKLNEIKEY